MIKGRRGPPARMRHRDVLIFIQNQLEFRGPTSLAKEYGICLARANFILLRERARFIACESLQQYLELHGYSSISEVDFLYRESFEKQSRNEEQLSLEFTT